MKSEVNKSLKVITKVVLLTTVKNTWLLSLLCICIAINKMYKNNHYNELDRFKQNFIFSIRNMLITIILLSVHIFSLKRYSKIPFYHSKFLHRTRLNIKI